MSKYKAVVMAGRWQDWIPDLQTASEDVTVVGAPTHEDLMREVVDADVVIAETVVLAASESRLHPVDAHRQEQHTAIE